MNKYKKSGWTNESARHSLAAKGVKTGRKINYAVNWDWAKQVPNPDKIKKITTTKYVGGDFEFTFQPIEGSLSIVEKEDGGYEAKYLVQDEDPQSPDEWGDDGLFLVHYHRDFDVRRNEVINEDDARAWYNGEKISQEKDYWVLPLEAYIHSGVSLTLDTFKGRLPQGHYEFDTSHVGLVLARKKDFKTKEKAEKAMKVLVEEWNQYLSGDVYGTVKDTYDKNKKLINNDAVWGNYGEKYALEALKEF